MQRKHKGGFAVIRDLPRYHLGREILRIGQSLSTLALGVAAIGYCIQNLEIATLNFDDEHNAEMEREAEKLWNTRS